MASVTPANRRAYDGVYRYAKEAHWNVRAIEYSLAADKRTHGKSGGALAITEILDLWNPDGIIVECAGRPPHLLLESFGNLPLVLLDCLLRSSARGWRVSIRTPFPLRRRRRVNCCRGDSPTTPQWYAAVGGGTR